MQTTLRQIRDYGARGNDWEKLLGFLNKKKADDEPLTLSKILDATDLTCALWCLRAVKGYDKEKRLYAVWCARQVQHLMKEEASVKALDVAERYANGEASDEELQKAKAAAKYVADVQRYRVMYSHHVPDSEKLLAEVSAAEAAEATTWMNPAFAASLAALHAAGAQTTMNSFAIEFTQAQELRRLLALESSSSTLNETKMKHPYAEELRRRRLALESSSSTLNETKMKHPYAEVLIAIANGEKIQHQLSSGKWVDTNATVALSEISDASYPLGKYRVKPKTININGIEVPEPLREAPPRFTEVWRLSLDDKPEKYRYDHNCELRKYLLAAGMLHLTREAALLHSKALRSFTDPRVIVEGTK